MKRDFSESDFTSQPETAPLVAVDNDHSKVGKTMQAKNATKRAHIASLSPEERMMLPLYLHYREQAITRALRPKNERKENTENS